MMIFISYAMLLVVLATIAVAMWRSTDAKSAPPSQIPPSNTEPYVSIGPIAGTVSLLIALVGVPDVLAPIGVIAFFVAALAAAAMFLLGVVRMASKQPAELAFWSAFASLSLAAAAFAAALATGISV